MTQCESALHSQNFVVIITPGFLGKLPALMDLAGDSWRVSCMAENQARNIYDTRYDGQKSLLTLRLMSTLELNVA